MFSKLPALLLIATIVFTNLHAQEISKTPVSAETEVKQRLFELDTLDVNYYFRANLPGDNFLVMEFKKLSYWPGKGNLEQIFKTARDVVYGVRDSFSHPGTSKRIDIHMPIKDEPLTARLFEHNEGGNLLVIKNGESAPLKIGMDTIRVLKTYSETTRKKDKRLAQVQYTFIVKDLEQITVLAGNSIIDSIDNVFSSLVEEKSRKWSQDDMWYHNMDVVYDPLAAGKKKRVEIKSVPGFFKGMDVDMNIGISLFRNTLAPNFDIGITYKWLAKEKDFTYVEFSLSSITFFDSWYTTDIGGADVSFANLEIGSMYNKKNTLIPLYRTSVGFGYKVSDYFPVSVFGQGYVYQLFTGQGYRIFFKYSLSKAITIMPDFYIFRNDNIINGPAVYSSFFGMTAYFKMF